ncbi:hypothetical protein [Paenibacillus xerothermodurans]|uniref:hypothetical protein n=1 Tax=Paenibacillus xerothermodurans TaxID=1977292 RepID=UPI0014026B40|nr:hypothetical protein [Paenibacillus xerothermodurans]
MNTHLFIAELETQRLNQALFIHDAADQSDAAGAQLNERIIYTTLAIGEEGGC